MSEKIGILCSKKKKDILSPLGARVSQLMFLEKYSVFIVPRVGTWELRAQLCGDNCT